MINQLGQSEPSDPNTSGATLLVSPSKPESIQLDSLNTNEF